MNAAELRSVLDLPTPVATTKKSTTTPKPRGINRELYDLVGGVPATALITNIAPRFKQRPKALSRTVPWVQATIHPDIECLKRWCRYGEDSKPVWNDVVPMQVEVPTFTDEEYAKHLQDPHWTQQETMYLMDLCQRFDLRFLVIHDRYEFPNAPYRTVEELKDRYYTVLRRMLRVHDQPTPVETSFDALRETERKRALEYYFTRSPAEIAEEAALMADMRKIQQMYKRWQKEHEQLLRGMDVRDVPAGRHWPGMSGLGFTTATALAPVHGGTGVGGAAGGTGIKKKKKDDARRESVLVGRKPPGGQPAGSAIRSQRMSAIKNAQTNLKVSNALLELGIPPRPAMSTEKICEAYEKLQIAISKMSDLKRGHDRLAQEKRSLQDKLNILMGKKTVREDAEGEEEIQVDDGDIAIANTRKRTRAESMTARPPTPILPKKRK